jgi:hypothetical protein
MPFDRTRYANLTFCLKSVMATIRNKSSITDQGSRWGAVFLCPGGLMRPNQPVELACREAAAPKASAKVYDFYLRETETRRRRRMRTLEQENALLARVLSETRDEIVRLRKVLSEP